MYTPVKTSLNRIAETQTTIRHMLEWLDVYNIQLLCKSPKYGGYNQGSIPKDPADKQY